MDLFEAIEKRYSYRGQYAGTPVPRADLIKIVRAGLAAPSGCNAQTTSVIALDDRAVIQQLGALMNKPNFSSAPAAICVLTQPIAAWQGRKFNVQDYAAAIENMLLAITALGYASCWVEGYVTGPDGIGRRMAEQLGVPAGYEVVAYLPVGVPVSQGARPSYKPFEERAWFNRFGGKG